MALIPISPSSFSISVFEEEDDCLSSPPKELLVIVLRRLLISRNLISLDPGRNSDER
jgi:hypothetical protein